MSGGHAHGLYVHGDSRIHLMRPQCKVVAALGFVVAVVATPRAAVWAFLLYALMLGITARAARVRVVFILRRLVVEAPFVAFALFLPFLSLGPRVELFGVVVARDGLWAAWNILAKASLGLGATVLLGATTQVPEILHGLERMRLPRAFTSIAHFMFRYADVITGEMRRMKVARASRGYEGRWLWQARAVAFSLGALFIRSFERGERVHLAMVSRGFDGSVPVLDAGPAEAADWVVAAVLPGAAVIVAALAWMVIR